jgi:hypothetical protein
MSAAPVAIDPTQIEQFVHALFRYADPGGYVLLRAFLDNADGAWRRDLWASPVIEEAGLDNIVIAAVKLADAAARASVPVVFAPPIATFKTPESAAEDNVDNGLVLTVEADERPEQARERLEDLLGPATLVVASGGIWRDPGGGALHDKLHLHWRLTEPTRESADHALLKEARRRAQAFVGADATAVPLVHPLRWPGSVHRKAAPRLARIIQVHE